ncbi:Uncharacterised protein [Candidatus Norongarragalina meridionalis]|nr:Uncharacterised protein [Candidatus Norongarragalina meridionalis]
MALRNRVVRHRKLSLRRKSRHKASAWMKTQRRSKR